MKKSWLGIDVGSCSVKCALIDEDKNLIKSSYHRNSGAIETVKKGLEEMTNEEYEVSGVGVTGSGRQFIGLLVGGDIIKTEVLAHIIGTLHYYPDVKTVMDIGGEDCKIMSLNNSVLESFKLNSICGAGTGSVIDSISNRMGVKIEDVGDLALKSTQRFYIPGKCGIFAQSTVVSKLNSGVDKSDILMGVIRALVGNYLMLAKGMDLSPPYVYQGATAKNKAIVRALEEQLDSEVIVPEYCDIMGAIGIALMTKDTDIEKTKFRGYALSNENYKSKNIISNGCENKCELTYLYKNENLVGMLGNKCEKCQLPKSFKK